MTKKAKVDFWEEGQTGRQADKQTATGQLTARQTGTCIDRTDRNRDGQISRQADSQADRQIQYKQTCW